MKKGTVMRLFSCKELFCIFTSETFCCGAPWWRPDCRSEQLWYRCFGLCHVCSSSFSFSLESKQKESVRTWQQSNLNCSSKWEDVEWSHHSEFQSFESVQLLTCGFAVGLLAVWTVINIDVWSIVFINIDAAEMREEILFNGEEQPSAHELK